MASLNLSQSLFHLPWSWNHRILMESDTGKNLLLPPPTMGPKRQNMFFYRFLSVMILFSGVIFVLTAFLITDIKELVSGGFVSVALTMRSNQCEQRNLPLGAESLPMGFIANTSDLEMRPLWGSPPRKESPMNLLAMAVGLKQKDKVINIVGKFISSNFVVMLFHYDGNVDGWKDLEWHDHVIHVSAPKQTKWWFAKRFLHPDIVSEYSYIFIWDEDLGVEHFNVDNYLSIIQKEGLDISQPAIDPNKSPVQHPFTARDEETIVHRRIAKKYYGYKNCSEYSKDPPCAGWVEIMAPVISKASWRCVWNMLQNDLVHQWGLDFIIGYCAQGDRFQRIGVVDAEYIVHYGVPSLGGSANNDKPESSDEGGNATSAVKSVRRVMLASTISRDRILIRRQSTVDMLKLNRRWKQAIRDDECWTDPYLKTKKAVLP